MPRNNAPPLVHSFPPVVGPAPRALIVGSMPGVASLRAGEYYAHPRNQFWPIMGELVGARPAQPYAVRIETLRGAGLALWDVLKSCSRVGSLDSAIRDEIPNDIEGLMSEYATIRHIFANGAKAEQALRRHIRLPEHVTVTRLPSTSPAHAAMSFADKCTAWRACLG